MKFIKRDNKYFFIMDDETEYEVDDHKLTKEKKNQILFHHKNVAPMKDQVADLRDKIADVIETLDDIKEKMDTWTPPPSPP